MDAAANAQEVQDAELRNMEDEKSAMEDEKSAKEDEKAAMERVIHDMMGRESEREQHKVALDIQISELSVTRCDEERQHEQLSQLTQQLAQVRLRSNWNFTVSK